MALGKCEVSSVNDQSVLPSKTSPRGKKERKKERKKEKKKKKERKEERRKEGNKTKNPSP